MQNRGIMPSVVRRAIDKGTSFSTKAGTISYYDAVNKIRVIAHEGTG